MRMRGCLMKRAARQMGRRRGRISTPRRKKNIQRIWI
jgi:hypothetical protein